MRPSVVVRPLSLTATVILTLLIAGAAPAAEIDPRLAYLQYRAAASGKAPADFAGSLRFAAPPDRDQLAELTRLGLRFGAHHSRTIYPARVPFACLAELQSRPDVLAVECAWRAPRPAPPPLAETRRVVEADLAQQVRSPLGGTLSGRGVTIAKIDSGIELEHMALFQLEEEERYAWLDASGDGEVGEGDAVDLDGDGLAGPGEALDFQETLGVWSFGNVFGQFDPGWDLLFNDLDLDGERDLGPPIFGEDDPTYGERLFLADDRDGDGRLDPDETLVALGRSKVRAVRDADGTVYRRGVDLLDAPRDAWPHGTAVAGILAAAWPGRHGMIGTAPGAELLELIVNYAAEPPFVTGFTDHLAWAAAEGADVLLVEDGEWVWEYLDGSSNFETMIDEYAAEGLVTVVPAGNLAVGGMHCRFRSGDPQSLTIVEGATASWPSFLWTEDVDLSLAVTPPVGETVSLPLDGTVVQQIGYDIYSNHSVSPRGTHRIDVALHTAWPGGPIHGTWRFHLAGPDCEVHGYFFDDASGWISESTWETGTEAATTVTWPATADSAITVAAYRVDDPPGDVRYYSSRGPRIDGRCVHDLAAPGHSFSTDPSRWNGYEEFGGTSNAAPYVAGAVALLKELDPTLDHGRCRRYLHAGAIPATDGCDAGGRGKLSVMGAVALLLDDMAEQPPQARPAVAARPNPFNAGTTIVFRQSVRGPARVRVFDLSGREVWHGEVADGPAGWREVAWDGRDAGGRSLPSGLYLAHVDDGARTAAAKLTLVK